MTNPVFSQEAIDRVNVLGAEPMTVNGAINKTFILFAVLLATSLMVWDLFFKGYTDKVTMLGFVGLIGGLISFFVVLFSEKFRSIGAIAYAGFEGLLLGGISAMFEKAYPGIAIQAIACSFAAMGSMLFLFKIGAIKCTEKFRSTIIIATLSVAVIYFIDFLGSLFGYRIPEISTSSNIGIGFSLIVVVIASLNFIIDFDIIEKGAQNMMSKNFEWYGAFGLMVTFIWLYIEMLKLLAKLRDR